MFTCFESSRIYNVEYEAMISIRSLLNLIARVRTNPKDSKLLYHISHLLLKLLFEIGEKLYVWLKK